MLSTLLNQKSGYSDTGLSRFCLLVLFERSKLNLFYPILVRFLILETVCDSTCLLL